MQTARVFQSGNSQAVRLPKAFRFKSDEVEILRRGDEVVLREKPLRPRNIADVLLSLPEDVFDGPRDDPPPQEREGL